MRLIGLAIILSAATASPALAQCPDATYGKGVARTLNATNEQDTGLIVSMSMMPKLMRVEYATEAAKRLDCVMTQFAVGSTTYELRANDLQAGTLRLAATARKGSPIAELLPVTDIMAAIEASKQGKTAQVSGYMLAIIDKSGLTAWRFYTDVPDQATLVADMTTALSGAGSPIVKVDKKGQATLFVAN